MKQDKKFLVQKSFHYFHFKSCYLPEGQYKLKKLYFSHRVRLKEEYQDIPKIGGTAVASK